MDLVSQQANPLVVFRLKPLNHRAKEVVRHPLNAHLVTDDGQGYLEIGVIPSKVNDGVTLATFGRDGDVFMEGRTVSRLQCAFEIDPISRVVMFYDKSHNNSSAVHSMDGHGIAPGGVLPKVFPFQYGRPRKVYVGPYANPVIGMCGEHRDLVLLRLIWSEDAQEAIARKANRLSMRGVANVPQLAKTIDDTETAPETTRVTRIHTPALGHAMLIRYQIWDVLGEGSSGVVHRVIDVDTGKIMALKTLKQSATTAAEWAVCQREVKILAEISHPHILDLIWSQHWDRGEAEIFCGLKDGALDALVRSGSYAPSLSLENLAQRVLHHMLQALDVLACRGVVHRDVKPENIFYVQRADGYHFQLGDFGLSNHANIATSGRVGTGIFMAPEMYSGNGLRTHKVDVWSLFVSILWVLDVGGFRDRSLRFVSYQNVQTTVQELAAHPDMASIRFMAAPHPDQRASAAQVICTCFNGDGLTTPRDKVPALPIEPPLGTVSAAVPAPTAQKQPTPPMPLRSPLLFAAPRRSGLLGTAPNPKHTPETTTKVSAGGKISPIRLLRQEAAARTTRKRQGLLANRSTAVVRAGDNNRVHKRPNATRTRDNHVDARLHTVLDAGVATQPVDVPIEKEKGTEELSQQPPGAFPEF